MYNSDILVTSLTESMKAFIIILTCLILIKGDIKAFKDRMCILALTPFILVLCSMCISLISSNDFITSTIYIVAILLLLKKVYGFNIVQAILSATLSLNILLISQLMTTCFDILYLHAMVAYNDFILTIPVFILQSFGLVIAKKYTLKDNILLNYDWSSLSRTHKYTIIMLIGFLYLGLNINIYFAHLYRSYDNQHIGFSYIQNHLHIFFIQSIIISYTSLLFIKRTLIYENYKLIFATPNQTYKTLLYGSTKHDIKGYLQLLDSVSIVSLSDLISYIHKYKEKYSINLNLMCYTDIGYYNFYNYFVSIRELFSILSRLAVISIHVDIKSLKNGIEIVIQVELNDLDKHKFIKLYKCNNILNSDKHIISLKNDNYINITIKEDVLC